jgi:dihydroorotase
MKRLIKGGRVVDPASGTDRIADVLIEGETIRGVLDPRDGDAVAHGGDAEVFRADGMVVAPGFIDLHVHLREPGYEHKETVATGTDAAVAGGFTAVACMANTNPVNDNQAVTEYILAKARAAGKAKVYPIGALTVGLKGEALADIGELKAAGVVALSDDGETVMNAEVMRCGLRYAAMFGLAVISHCEDRVLRGDGVMHEGFVSTELGLPPIPGVAEEVMVARDLLLARETGARLHVAHVSSAGSVDLIRWGKSIGVNVTAEAAPHHFILTDEAVRGYDPNFKMSPPLCGEEDRAALVRGMADGTIDCIATDHAPHDLVIKNLEFEKSANGVIGLETALPLTLRLVREGSLPLARAIELLTIGPARALGLPGGTLAAGADADVVVFDPEARYRYDATMVRSRSKNSPFLGWEMTGRVVRTFVRGRPMD